MKLRFAVWGLFLALCVTPAFADAFRITNEGLISGSASSSGINLVSTLTGATFEGITVFSGPHGTIGFNTGSFTGSLLGGGQFSSGTFDMTVDGLGSILFASNFSGTWSKLGDDLYKLVGTFTATADGLSYTGVTTQFFELENEDGRLSFDDVHGKTCIRPVGAVPEPGTLTLLGTGLLGLGGMVRRKFAAAK